MYLLRAKEYNDVINMKEHNDAVLTLQEASLDCSVQMNPVRRWDGLRHSPDIAGNPRGGQLNTGNGEVVSMWISLGI